MWCGKRVKIPIDGRPRQAAACAGERGTDGVRWAVRWYSLLRELELEWGLGTRRGRGGGVMSAACRLSWPVRPGSRARRRGGRDDAGRRRQGTARERSARAHAMRRPTSRRRAELHPVESKHLTVGTSFAFFARGRQAARYGSRRGKAVGWRAAAALPLQPALEARPRGKASEHGWGGAWSCIQK